MAEEKSLVSGAPGGEGTGEGEQQSAPGEQNPGTGEGEQQPAPGGEGQVIFTTDGVDVASIPDEFKDDKGNVKTSDLLKRFAETSEAAKNSLSGAPDKGYKITLPDIEGLDSEAVQSLELDKDPVMAAVMDAAKEIGMPQDIFDKFSGPLIQKVVGNAVDNSSKIRTELGKDADTLIKANSDFYSQHLSDEEFESLKGMMRDAGSVRVMDKIRNMVVKSGAAIPSGGEGVPSQLTEADLRGLMASKAYTDPAHPEYKATQEKVRKGFEKIYGS